MLLTIVICFLALSIVFYTIFGGADFGAGILDMVTRKSYRKQIAHAIGPVWEANHIWLILVVVILFMGFPRIYSVLSLYLHIPILLLLIGIVMRGTAFAFMHYDAIQDRSILWYEWAFKISSVISSLFIGIIVGATMLGNVNPEASTFNEAFITPWLNGFSFTVGLFTVSLFTFLASVFMIGESDTSESKKEFTRIAKRTQVILVVAGMAVFGAAHLSQFPLLSLFFNSWPAVLCLIAATILLPLLWRSLSWTRTWVSRFIAGSQVFLILAGWFLVQYPTIIRIQGSAESLSLINTAAPEATLLQLALALIIGSCLIIPALLFLMKTFKGEQF